MGEAAAADAPSEGYASVLSPLAGLTNSLDQRREALSCGSWHPSSDELSEALRQLAEQVNVTRDAVEALQRTQRDERQRPGHEMRSALNAIAGWAHILRLDTNPTTTVARAADVLDRNVRLLSKLIDSTTA